MTFGSALDRVRQDVRYAWRGLRRTPTFTAVAVATLALGIAATTTMFGLVDAVAFRPTAAARLSHVYLLRPSRAERLRFSDVSALARTPTPSVAAVASALEAGAPLVQTEGRAEYVLAERVSGGYADVFGLHAQAGRWISPQDDREVNAAVVVISDRLWRDWFNGDQAIVGRATVTLDTPHRVIGVAPAGFRGVQTGLAPTEIWRPIGPPVAPNPQSAQGRPVLRRLQPLTFIRTRPEASHAQIVGEITTFLENQPDPDRSVGAPVLEPAIEAMRVSAFATLTAGVLACAALVFFAACANLANLLYARGTERSGELAVRRSLGATTGSLFGLTLAETGIIALAAAAVGLALAIGAASAFTAAFPTFRLARNRGLTIDLAPDYWIFLYAFGAGAAAALVVGLLSAWRASRVQVLRGIGGSVTSNVVSTSRRGLPLTFVSVQITAAVLLLIGAGLFFENTQSVLDRRVHYDTSQLTAARLRWTDQPLTGGAEPAAALERLRAMTTAERANDTAVRRAAVSARREAFFSTLLERARALPGVDAASLTDALPGGTAPSPASRPGALQSAASPEAGGRPRNVNASWISVSPGFLETIGVPLVRGRAIQAADTHGAPLVAVLSRSAAEALWPDEDAIGKRINCCLEYFQTLTVVGVAEDPVSSSDHSPWTRHANFVLLSAAQTGQSERFVLLRSAAPEGHTAPLRALIHGLDTRVPVFDAGPVDEFLLAGVAIARAQRAVTITLGLLALGIATFGIYGVVGYFVSRRMREFGLRLALGATPRQILKLVVDYAIHIVLIGLLPGVLLASLGTRLFEGRLSGLMPNGITMWVAAPTLVLAAGVLAGLLPARRAARVDPNVTLREL